MRAIKEKQMGFLFQFQLFQFVFWGTPISPLIYIYYIYN